MTYIEFLVYENIQTWVEVRLVIDRPHVGNDNTGP